MKLELAGIDMFESIWIEFCNKMKQDKLQKDDFTSEMYLFLSPLLCGVQAEERRKKFLSSPYELFSNDIKGSVMLHCPDDDYRFDFLFVDDKWKLSFIECVTLPISDISVLPYTNFKELPQKETDIRREKEIAKLIFFYNKFKNLIGRQKAMELLFDGAGEFICARSWVPFYNDRLCYIAYAAWMENRIYGEQVDIVEFDDQCCCLRFHQHIWRKMYLMTGHMQKLIDYTEYMELYEAIWKNRASEAGWAVQFNYYDEDTELIFIKP